VERYDLSGPELDRLAAWCHTDGDPERTIEVVQDVVDGVDDEREARDARGVHRRPRPIPTKS
jgi:hypothetical protein